MFFSEVIFDGQQKKKKSHCDLDELTPASVWQGLVPFYINATAGTTVYGAFDPLSDIADICQRHSLWMHVDVRYIILSL